MTTMIAEVYEAFIAAGTPQDKARAAAKAVADYEARFARIETDLAVLKWMSGTIVAGVAALIIESFFV